MTTTTIDCTPSPAALKQILLTILEGSSSAEDRDYARGELERLYPALTVAHDQHNELLVVGSPGELSAYCAQIAKRHGAGHCDIYSFEDRAMTPARARDFLGAFDTETITLQETTI